VSKEHAVTIFNAEGIRSVFDSTNIHWLVIFAVRSNLQTDSGTVSLRNTQDSTIVVCQIFITVLPCG